MELNLYKDAKIGEKFHLQPTQPLYVEEYFKWGCGRVRQVKWFGLKTDKNEIGIFNSWTLRLYDIDDNHFRAIQYYKGTVKCDGSRSKMLFNGQLGGTAFEQLMYVMTTTPSELMALRIKKIDKVPVWNNMGGC
jgi:hypothetical protein